MAFSVGVEMINIRVRAKFGAKPVELRGPHMPEAGGAPQAAATAGGESGGPGPGADGAARP